MLGDDIARALPELRAHAESMMRDIPELSAILDIGAFRRTVRGTVRSGAAAQDVALTVTEFMLLQALAQRPGFVKSRDQLMDAAYQDDIYVDDRTIDSHIKRLRKKFRQADPQFDGIDTLYGAGYRFSGA